MIETCSREPFKLDALSPAADIRLLFSGCGIWNWFTEFTYGLLLAPPVFPVVSLFVTATFWYYFCSDG